MEYKIDTIKLTECIDRCLDLSMDARLQLAEQKGYNKRAKSLRARLQELIVIRFETNTEQLKSANAALGEVNTKLKSDLEAINEAAATLQAIANLVKILSDLASSIAAVVL